MKVLLAIAAAGVALFVSTTAAGASTAEAVGRLGTPNAAETSRQWSIAPGAVSRWGAVGRWGAVRAEAAGFRW